MAARTRGPYEGCNPPTSAFGQSGDNETLLGVGALRRHSADQGEVKRMYQGCRPSRRKGAGSAMLRHIIATARESGMSQLSRETGSRDYFLPAQMVSGATAFEKCPIRPMVNKK